jgi:hypothetical protein
MSLCTHALKVAIILAYIPMFMSLRFLQGEQGDMQTPIEWDIQKKL